MESGEARVFQPQEILAILGWPETIEVTEAQAKAEKVIARLLGTPLGLLEKSNRQYGRRPSVEAYVLERFAESDDVLVYGAIDGEWRVLSRWWNDDSEGGTVTGRGLKGNTSADAAVVSLSAEEEAEFQTFGFKSRLPIVVSGEIPARDSNRIKIGGIDVPISDTPLTLLLRLMVALKEDPQGYVLKGDPVRGGGLVGEGILSAGGIDQGILRLRQAVLPALGVLPHTDFIEGRLAKHIRLSTHPSLITVSPHVLEHPDKLICGLTKRWLAEGPYQEQRHPPKQDQATD